MRVRVVQLGHINGAPAYPGDELDIPRHLFSHRWMEALNPAEVVPEPTPVSPSEKPTAPIRKKAAPAAPAEVTDGPI